MKKIGESVELLKKQMEQNKYINTQKHKEKENNYISVDMFQDKKKELFADN